MITYEIGNWVNVKISKDRNIISCNCCIKDKVPALIIGKDSSYYYILINNFNRFKNNNTFLPFLRLSETFCKKFNIHNGYINEYYAALSYNALDGITSKPFCSDCL